MRQLAILILTIALFAACDKKESEPKEKETDSAKTIENAESGEKTPFFADSGANAQKGEIAPEPKSSSNLTFDQKVMYCLGLDLGANLQSSDYEVDMELLKRGIEDSYKNKDYLLSEAEITETMRRFQSDMMKKQQSQMEKAQREFQAKGSENKTLSKKFMEDNKSKPGVKTTPSGLQYKVVKSGSGENPKLDEVALIHFKGELIDGTVFEDTRSKGSPTLYPVQNPLKGVQQALQMMKPGAKWILYIPPELAFAERGAPPIIPPNSALIVEIELISNEGKMENMRSMQPN